MSKQLVKFRHKNSQGRKPFSASIFKCIILIESSSDHTGRIFSTTQLSLTGNEKYSVAGSKPASQYSLSLKRKGKERKAINESGCNWK